MPGYLVSPMAAASGVASNPTGDVSATNVQDAIIELASEKATVAALSSVEGIALLGL